MKVSSKKIKQSKANTETKYFIIKSIKLLLFPPRLCCWFYQPCYQLPNVCTSSHPLLTTSLTMCVLHSPSVSKTEQQGCGVPCQSQAWSGATLPTAYRRMWVRNLQPVCSRTTTAVQMLRYLSAAHHFAVYWDFGAMICQRILGQRNRKVNCSNNLMVNIDFVK